jgi:hypothetical protein
MWYEEVTLKRAIDWQRLTPGQYAKISPAMARAVMNSTVGDGRLPKLGHERQLSFVPRTGILWLANKAGQYELRRS